MQQNVEKIGNHIYLIYQWYNHKRDNSDGWERISLETLINLLTQEQMQWSDFSGEPQKTLNSTQIDIICTIKCTIIKNTN